MKKKLIIAIVALSFFILRINAQTPEKETQANQSCQSAAAEINRLTEETINFFKQNKFDEAYSSAKKASDLTEIACPEDNAKRLSMAMNVAEIQIKRGKDEEARKVFKNNLLLAQTIYGENSPKFNTFLDYLIKLSVNEISNEEFESYALKSVEVKKAVFGKESYEAMLELHRIAVFYDRRKKFDKAEDFYLQAIAIHDKLPQDAKTKKIHPVENYRVLLIRNFGEEGRKKDAEFMKNRTADMFADGKTSGVLNGRAISLPAPLYPLLSRPIGARGAVEVSVVISESGDVIEAKAVSGNPYLRQAAVAAAKEAKFLPIYVNGRAVKITGSIIYNFLP